MEYRERNILNGNVSIISGSGNSKSLTPSVASILAPGTTVAPHRRQSPSSASLAYMAMLVSDETMWQLIVWATSPMDGRDFGFSCKQHIAILASCRACRNHWQQLVSIRSGIMDATRHNSYCCGCARTKSVARG